MWTLTRIRGKMSNRWVVCLPLTALKAIQERPSHMIHNRSLLPIFHLAALLILSVGLAAPASAEWKEKVLYSFQGGTNDGFVPAGGVVFDKQGNL